MECCSPVRKSLAPTCKMPLASIRNRTSMRGSPAGAGGTFSVNRASERQSFASSRSPCRTRSEEHTSELQSRLHLVCRLLLEKKKKDEDRMFLHPNNKSLI